MRMVICQFCKREIETPDYGDGVLDYSRVYEYRGFSFHDECFDSGVELVEGRRKQVIEKAEQSIKSQLKGELFYGDNSEVGADGLPMIRPKMPRDYDEYEEGKL